MTKERPSSAAPRKPASRRTLAGALVLAVLLAIGAGTLALWRAHSLRTLVARHLPTLPDEASVASPALAERLRTATARTRGLFTAADGLAELAALLHANGFTSGALTAYEGLRQIEPSEARWPHRQAHVLAGFGQLAEAIPLWRQSSELDPDYTPARLRLGDALLKSNQLTEAERVYREVLARAPQDPYAYLGVARVLMARSDWAAARNALETGRRARPEFVGTLILLATVEERLGNEDAARALRAEIAMREFSDLPDPWLEALLDDCYDAYRVSVGSAVATYSGSPDRAVHLLQRAIDLAPHDGSYERQLGKLLFQLSRLSEARPHLERATQLAPQDSAAWSLLVDLLEKSGDASGMRQALQSGLRHCPDSAALRYANGRQLARAGQVGAAIGEFRRAQRLKPDEARPFVDLALLFFQQERIEEGLAELRGALVAEPDHPLAMSILARHAIETGDAAQARHWIGRLRRQHRFAREDLAALAAAFRQSFRQEP